MTQVRAILVPFTSVVLLFFFSSFLSVLFLFFFFLFLKYMKR